jgi:hypothetical protein
MARVMIIVAADALELYHYFQGGFVEIDAITVILDRRRSSTDVTAPAGGERRASSHVDDHLRQRHFAIVKLLPA